MKEIQSGAPLENNDNANDRIQIETTSADNEPVNLSVEVLADLIHNMIDACARFQPYLQEYANVLLNDKPEFDVENRRQRFCNNVNDMMHLISHLFHNFSDLHINLRDSPPRRMRTMIPFQSAIISAAPLETNIEIPITMADASASRPGQYGQSIIENRVDSNTNTNGNIQNDRTAGVNLTGPVNYLECTPNTITFNQITAQILQHSGDPGSQNTTNEQNIEQSTINSSASLNALDQSYSISPSNDISASEISKVNSRLDSNTILNTMLQPQNSSTTSSTNPLHNRNSSDNVIGRTCLGSNTASNSNYLVNRNCRNQSGIPRGDPYLPCNSVHFLNNLINNYQPQNNSNIRDIHHTNNASSSKNNLQNTSCYRRRHPAENQNILHEEPSNNNAMFPSDSNYIPSITAQTINGQSLIGNTSNIIMSSNNATDKTNINQCVYTNKHENIVIKEDSCINALLEGLRTDLKKNLENSKNTNNSLMNLLNEIILILDSNNPNDERLQRPIREFLHNYTGTFCTDSNKPFWEFCDAVFFSVTLKDLIDLFMSKNIIGIFSKFKAFTRNYIKNSIFENQQVSNETLLQLIDKLTEFFALNLNIDDNDSYFENSKIDFERSLKNLIQHYLRILLANIFTDEAGTQCSSFYKDCQEFKDHIVGLYRCCFKNPDKLICNIICSKVNFILQNSNTIQSVTNALREYLLQKIHDTLSATQINSKIAERFIRYKSFYDEKLDKSQNNLMNLGYSDKKKTLDNNAKLKSVLPDDWVPVITSDFDSQASLMTDCPLSDAYTAGMPSKRRKLFKKTSLNNKIILKTIFNRVSTKMNIVSNETSESIFEAFLNKKRVDSMILRFDQLLSNRLLKMTDFFPYLKPNFIKNLIASEKNKRFSNRKANRVLHESKKLFYTIHRMKQ